jgi:hypothetical protein
MEHTMFGIPNGAYVVEDHIAWNKGRLTSKSTSRGIRAG